MISSFWRNCPAEQIRADLAIGGSFMAGFLFCPSRDGDVLLASGSARVRVRLVGGIDGVVRGEIVVDIPRELSMRWAERIDGMHRLATLLTARERECLEMLVEGLDTAAMVARLGVSRTTIRTHIQAVLTKLGVHSRLAAAAGAGRYRLPGNWAGANKLDTPIAPAGGRRSPCGG